MKRVNYLEIGNGWLDGTGPEADIVISSRIRLARNINGFNFIAKLGVEDSEKLVDKVRKAIVKKGIFVSGIFLDFYKINILDKHILFEKHLVSKELIEMELPNGIIFEVDGAKSVMINEEDHLRMQVMKPGLDFKALWRAMRDMEVKLEDRLEFAFDKSLGYLTSCPTNVGTGLRASAMLHLPSLVMTKQIDKVLQALARLNIAVRGLYGEGTRASGNFFQFSNQVTLGKSEEDIISELEKIVRQVIDHEREARKMLMKGDKKDKLVDKIFRALGTLKFATLMSSEEATALLSMLRLGIDLGVIGGITRDNINTLFIAIQPAHLQLAMKKVSTPIERDKNRAKMIRDLLKDAK